tara:strand:- start:1459 stop:1974 length:516 start_codon:yes stop_codon:yes gene_type:complete
MFSKILGVYRRLFWSAEKYGRYLGVSIGEKCSIATKYFGSEPYLVKIGNHVQITNGVKFFTHGGGWVFRKDIPDFDTFGKIEIKDNVYIGNNVLIMPGVTINSNVIIAAGSVVTRSIPEGKIIGGNPAKEIGEVSNLRERLLPINTKTKGLNYENKKRILLKLDSEKFIIK